MSFGATLRTARTSRGMTQTDLGAAMSPPESIFKISLWECDKRQPGADQIRGLCRVLQVSADALLELAPVQPGLSSAPVAAPAQVAASVPAHTARPAPVDRFAALLAKCGPPPVASPPDIPPRSKKNRRKTPTNPMVGSEATLAGKRMADVKQ